MESALAVAVYVLLGAALVAASIWYASAVWQRFFAVDAGTPALAPIDVVGAEEAAARAYAAGLPAMIVAATHELKGRTNAAIRSLNQAKAELAKVPKPPEAADLPVPSEFRQELTVNLKIADVEVGPLLALLFERARDRNVVKLTVALDPKGGKSEVFGFLPGAAGYAFAAKVDGDLPSIARAIAAQLVQRAAQERGDAAFATLETDSFLETIDALHKYARLTAQRPFMVAAEDITAPTAGNPGRLRDEYAKILDQVGPLARSYVAWEGLQWLAAHSAREAHKWASAREFFSNLKRLAERAGDESLVGQSSLLLAEAEAKLASELRQEPGAPPAVGAPACPAEPPPPPPGGPTVAQVLAAVRLTEPGRAAGATIGVVGPPPSAAPIPGVAVVGAAAVVAVDETLRDHQATVWQAVRLLAPDASFLFSPLTGPGGAMSMSDLLAATAALAECKPAVLLLAFGGSAPMPTVDALIRRYAADTLFVLPAGNNRGASPYAGVADVALVAAAATPDGAPASFSDSAPQATWAPGTRIPVVPPSTGRQTLRDGTSYSAAVAAGAAAILAAAYPKAGPARLREALIATASPAPGRDAPPIIDVPAALEWLGRKVGS